MRSKSMLIDGQLVRGDEELRVLNPATGELLCVAPRASEAQLDRAVAAAHAAFPGWSSKQIEERQQALLLIADKIDAKADEIADVLTREQGKPLRDALGETHAAAAFFRYFASFDLASRVLEDSEVRRAELHRRPLGVVAAIVPWNYPLTLMAFKLPAALLAGNTVVLKPAPTTPLATLAVAELIKDFLPPGVLNVIVDGGELGEKLVKHPDVRKISFTGSTETGKRVMAGAASGLKRLTLELGGNDAAILLDDIDTKDVAPKIFAAAFGNAGQTCIAVKRLYVQERIYDEVCDELVRLATIAVVGDGLQPETQIGPLQNKAQFDKVQRLIAQARSDGTVIAKGPLPRGGGYFIRPTIVRDIDDGTALVDEEQFGPVLPVIKFRDENDAVSRANASPYGLGGSVWSADLARAKRLALQMTAGTVWINKHADLAPGIPFAGAGSSGIGSELGERALEEFTQIQVMNSPPVPPS